MAGIGKASKTNLGQDIGKLAYKDAAGNPSLDREQMATGTILDIRTPGDIQKKQGSGIMVRIEFDDANYTTDAWLALKEDYQNFKSTIGNREAVLKNPPRVMYHFSPLSFEEGYAELICDNKQEQAFNQYEHNQSNSYIGILSGLAFGTPPLG